MNPAEPLFNEPHTVVFVGLVLAAVIIFLRGIWTL